MEVESQLLIEPLMKMGLIMFPLKVLVLPAILLQWYWGRCCYRTPH